jgi:hypothetical protein
MPSDGRLLRLPGSRALAPTCRRESGLSFDAQIEALNLLAALLHGRSPGSQLGESSLLTC